MKRSFQDIHRVLENKGILYLAVNVRTQWGALVHKLLSAFRIDKGHPHTFTEDSVQELLTAHHFRTCRQEIEDYRRVKQKYCNSINLKDKVKGYTGIGELLYHVICQKI